MIDGKELDERPRPWAEPYRIKMVELIPRSTPEDRARALATAGWNTFLLRSSDVTIDLLTDSGTNAMSDRQWSAMMLGDEAYAGSASYYKLEAAIQRAYGYAHVVPTHQGRGAEHLLSRLLVRPGHVVPGNMYFTTTRAHQELAGGTFEDVIVREAHDPRSEHPFKGNVDLDKLERLIRKVGPKNVPYVCVAATVNMAGGQPISLANLRAVRELTRAHGIRVFLDATRAIENAWLVREREPGQSERSLAAILRDICALRARIGQVRYVGERLAAAGIPIVRPIGGHAVFLDARAILPHVPQDAFPAQALAGELYLEAGIRSMERGIVSAGRDPATGEHRRPRLELVRLTFPRRVYTQAHCDVVIDAVERVVARSARVRGLRLVHEPRHLRFFQARFAPLDEGGALPSRPGA